MSETTRAKLTVMAGSGLSVLFGALSALALTHLISPALYGTYQALEAITLIFSVGGTFALERALYASRSPSEKQALVWLAGGGVALASFVAVIVLVAGIRLNWLPVKTAVVFAGAFVLFTTLLRGWFVILRAWHLSHKAYASTASGDLGLSFSLFCARLGAGFSWPSLSGLLWAGFLGPLIGLALLLRGISLPRPRWHGLRQILKSHKSYVLLESWGGFLRPLGQRGLVAALLPLYGAEKAAFAALALLLLLQPLQVIIGAMIDVTRSRLIEHPDEARRLLLTVICATPVLLLAGSSGLHVLTPLILPENWWGVRELSWCLIPLLYAMMLARTLQALCSQYRAQGWALAVDLTMALGSVGGVVLSGLAGVDLSSTLLAIGCCLSAGMFTLVRIAPYESR